ncbi:hypothetical protein [Mucilaginibacter sp.]|uniref:hypothetical protein n=1 Tax=Mucilaginibacter sp. TaxID=1882438 RepID=UPI003D105E7C
MTRLKLNNYQDFAIELLEKQARLIVYNNGVENVCRKERISKLKHFAQSTDDHLFKGRLQLHKSEVGIAVIVKGEIAGFISAEAFMNNL